MLGTVFLPPKNPGVWWMIYNEANDRVETPFVTAAFAPFLIQYNVFFVCVNSVRGNADTESHVMEFKMLSVQTELQMFFDTICKNYVS